MIRYDTFMMRYDALMMCYDDDALMMRCFTRNG